MKRKSNTKTLLLHERSLNRSGYARIAGVDEAGRGPLAGPVVAGAVILNGYDFREDIDDSKKLSPKKRDKAYKEIIEKNGGKNSMSVSGNTSFILAGENLGQSKKEKAMALRVPMLREIEFLRIIGEE